jgi:hypothetical protein
MKNGTSSPELSLFWQVEHPAKRLVSRVQGKEWQMLVADWPLPLSELLHACSLAGLSGKMSWEFCLPTEAGTLEPSSGHWETVGMGGATECLTLAISESPSPEDESFSLRTVETIIETGEIPQRFYLTNHSIELLNTDRRKFQSKSFRLLSVQSDGAKVCRTTALHTSKMPME